jgi:2-keto-3-deoxy-L-rhamnonate aldolase RhmA
MTTSDREHRILSNSLTSFENTIKATVARGEVSVGCFLVSGSSFMAEALATQPLDWMVIDMEASHATREHLLHVLQALNAYPVTPIVRVPAHDRHHIESSLDFGARGIMAPKVDTAAQASHVANACFYPPKGNRGINCIRASGYYSLAKQYFEKANAAVVSIVQVESHESVENVYDIAAVRNVDVVFMGLGDLAASYGQHGIVTGGRMDDARKRVVAACRATGKIAGLFAHNVDAANQYAAEGFQFVAVGNEIKYVVMGLEYCLRKINRKRSPTGPAPNAQSTAEGQAKP